MPIAFYAFSDHPADDDLPAYVPREPCTCRPRVQCQVCIDYDRRLPELVTRIYEDDPEPVAKAKLQMKWQRRRPLKEEMRILGGIETQLRTAQTDEARHQLLVRLWACRLRCHRLGWDDDELTDSEIPDPVTTPLRTLYAWYLGKARNLPAGHPRTPLTLIALGVAKYLAKGNILPRYPDMHGKQDMPDVGTIVEHFGSMLSYQRQVWEACLDRDLVPAAQQERPMPDPWKCLVEDLLLWHRRECLRFRNTVTWTRRMILAVGVVYRARHGQAPRAYALKEPGMPDTNSVARHWGNLPAFYDAVELAFRQHDLGPDDDEETYDDDQGEASAAA